MKIWGEIPKVLGVYSKQKSVNKAEEMAGLSGKKDAVSISNEAKDFQTVMKAIKDVPDMRTERISELTEKIETGNYNVDGKEIADKILRSIIDKKA